MRLARLIGIGVCSILISSAALAADETMSGASSRGETEIRTDRDTKPKADRSGADSGEKPTTKEHTTLHGKDANGGFRSSTAGDGTSGMANPAPVPGAAE
jgi:hypothetical protein